MEFSENIFYHQRAGNNLRCINFDETGLITSKNKVMLNLISKNHNRFTVLMKQKLTLPLLETYFAILFLLNRRFYSSFDLPDTTLETLKETFYAWYSTKSLETLYSSITHGSGHAAPHLNVVVILMFTGV